MMKLFGVAALISAIACSAHAADITYTNTLAGDGLTANYSITTDGALGQLTLADLVAFSATISSSTQSVSFNQLSYGASLDLDDTLATASGLIASPDAGINGPPDYINSAYAPNDIVIFENAARIDLSVGNTTETGYATVGRFYAQAAVSAAPEPGSWLLMVAGIGGMGLMLRRARRPAVEALAA
jgi:opacity protein-like surface antigen